MGQSLYVTATKNMQKLLVLGHPHILLLLKPPCIAKYYDRSQGSDGASAMTGRRGAMMTGRRGAMVPVL